LEHKGGKVIHWAINEDKPAVLRTLMDMKVDMKIPNSDGWSPIHAAAMKGKLGIIGALLDSGIDVNYAGYRGRTPLHQALAANRPESVSFLISKGAKTNILDDDSIRPVHLAVDFGATEALKALPLTIEDFEAKALNGQNKLGFTPLLLACEEGRVDVLKLLIEHGGDPHEKINDGE
ncbi:ankyrin, partial [Zopfia rhizophila CBS 207.26]